MKKGMKMTASSSPVLRIVGYYCDRYHEYLIQARGQTEETIEMFKLDQMITGVFMSSMKRIYASKGSNEEVMLDLIDMFFDREIRLKTEKITPQFFSYQVPQLSQALATEYLIWNKLKTQLAGLCSEWKTTKSS